VKLVAFPAAIVVMGLVFLSFSGCSGGKREVVVFEAASLFVPFEKMEKEFERTHPDIDVKMEGHGSIQVVRHVTEIHDEVDVVAVADLSLIPLLMYQTEMADGKGPYADWAIGFATNQVGIAYTPASKYADEINAQNWYEILARSDVNLGLSDPRLDAMGYRCLMALQLAQSHYGDDTIFEKIVGDAFDPPLSVTKQGAVCQISVPEVVEPSSERVHMRAYSLQMLALLDSHDIDYAFEYKSVAEQHGLRFLELPPEINMSSEALRDWYSTVNVRLDFRRFASVTPEFEGEPVIYGMTIPRNTQHLEDAIEFVKFVIGPEGQRILAEAHQPPLAPARIDNKDKAPSALKPFVQ
jgi:molybdate/tungstate transport system substrate-binding protein